MRTKQFKSESKKLMDMMINSIYTHKEIFLREIISNASDAIDKLYFKSLTDDSVSLSRGDFKIEIKLDKKGLFRLNLFSHSADDYTNYLDNTQRNGVGVTFQREFDSFIEFFRKLFSRRKDEVLKKDKKTIRITKEDTK